MVPRAAGPKRFEIASVRGETCADLSREGVERWRNKKSPLDKILCMKDALGSQSGVFWWSEEPPLGLELPFGTYCAYYMLHISMPLIAILTKFVEFT